MCAKTSKREHHLCVHAHRLHPELSNLLVKQLFEGRQIPLYYIFNIDTN